MQLLKFSFLLTLFYSGTSFAIFSDSECLKSSFKTSIAHKGKPFGLSKNVLTIQKNSCVIAIDHEKLKFMKNRWVIDVCRQPIHIKKGTGAIEVLKKEGACNNSQGGEFCKGVKKITDVIQDDGLIFAQGEKENISTDHGKIYCSYLLVKTYLEKDFIFSRGKEVTGVLTGAGSPTTSVNAPVQNSTPNSTTSDESNNSVYDF